MNRKYSIYLGLIALLAVANLGRWWLQSGKGSEQAAARGQAFSPEDFSLRVDVPDAGGGSGRNLFQPRSGASRMTAAHTGPGAVPIAAPQPATSEQIEMETGLGKLKLLGVVFHAGKRQAYLALGKESVIALAGDTVFGQFAVDQVNVDAIELRDLNTNTTRRIPVSGK